jgi:hypothetical protein
MPLTVLNAGHAWRWYRNHMKRPPGKPAARDRPWLEILPAAMAGIFIAVLLASCGGGGGDSLDVDEWHNVDTVYNAAATADLNGDAAADMIFSRTLEQNKVVCKDTDCDIKKRFEYTASVFLQDPLAPGTFLKEPSYELKDKGTSLGIDDLDLDGIVDFAATQKDAGSIGVFLQKPGLPGEFLERVNFAATGLPTGLAIGELNGDGVNDMAVAGNDLAVLTNEPLSPGSAFIVTHPGVGVTVAVAVADIDGDGRNDLAATSGDNVIVLPQDHAPAPPGSFSSVSVYASGINAADVAVGDLNGDSLPDLAVANQGGATGNVAILMQDPAAIGTFLPAAGYDTGVNSVDVEIGHLNDDALPDLAVANKDKDGGSISVLLQDPLMHGVFLDAVNYPGQRGPHAVAIDDMNGDGLADLVVADKGTSVKQWPYIRFQDINNPGVFLEPVHLE